jgi:hypothetical protein
MLIVLLLDREKLFEIEYGLAKIPEKTKKKQ